jgi:rhodanese-related sulfurtransferase
MNILNYFKPVETWTAEQVRQFLKDRNPDDYNLIDVRQPAEYERMHLPGGRLIPVADLPSHLSELDPRKPTICY